MMRAALDLAFGTFAVHRVGLGVFDTNPRAQACYERVGFQVEGTRAANRSWRLPGSARRATGTWSR